MAGDAERVVLVLRPPIDRADIPEHCHRLTVMLRDSGRGIVICDVSALVDVDVVIIELVARLQLTASRLGGRVRLYRPSQRLTALLVLMGLHGVLRIEAESGSEYRWQSEEGEESFGVEERIDTDNPTL